MDDYIYDFSCWSDSMKEYPETISDLSPKELEFLIRYRQLNPEQQKELESYVDFKYEQTQKELDSFRKGFRVMAFNGKEDDEEEQ